MVMKCEECAFYSRKQQDRSTPPCTSCNSDLSDKGYCVAVNSETGLIPVITKIFDENHAREIIARGMRNGSCFELLHWSNEVRAYQAT
jgi:hypothetical protein